MFTSVQFVLLSHEIDTCRFKAGDGWGGIAVLAREVGVMRLDEARRSEMVCCGVVWCGGSQVGVTGVNQTA